jgi:hypothetical protein
MHCLTDVREAAAFFSSAKQHFHPEKKLTSTSFSEPQSSTLEVTSPRMPEKLLT